MNKNHREKRLYDVLKATFSPSFLEVRNESDQHNGHRGSPHSGESHYQVCIASGVFSGIPLKEAHQKIYQAIDQEFQTGLHALSIKILKKGERPSGP